MDLFDISETDIMTEPATDYTPDAYLANEGIDLRNNILAPGAPNPTPNNQLSTPIRHKFTYQPPSIQPISPTWRYPNSTIEIKKMNMTTIN